MDVRHAFAALLVAAIPLPALAQAPASLVLPVAFRAVGLQAAEQDALAHSPDLKAAEAVLRENQAAYDAARGALGPSLTAGYAEAPQGGPSDTTIAQRLTTVGLQTNLGDVAAYRPLTVAARANLLGAQASLIAAQRRERVKTVGLYYDALKAREIARARDESLRTAREERDAADVRVHAGDAPRLDLVRANVAVARATAAAELAHSADQNATEALRSEIGTAVALDATVEQPVRATAPTPVPAAAAVDAAVKQRADLVAAAQTAAAAQAAAAAAHRKELPGITLGVGYETGVDSGVQVHGPTVNVSMNVPLNGVARAQAVQQDAAAQEQLAKQQVLERQIRLEVGAAARTLAASRNATAASHQAAAEALTEVQATELGYRTGASSSLEVTTARETFAQAHIDELAAVYDELKAAATLQLEMGP